MLRHYANNHVPFLIFAPAFVSRFLQFPLSLCSVPMPERGRRRRDGKTALYSSNSSNSSTQALVKAITGSRSGRVQIAFIPVTSTPDPASPDVEVSTSGAADHLPEFTFDALDDNSFPTTTSHSAGTTHCPSGITVKIPAKRYLNSVCRSL
jgi:hypothetical protein